MHHALRVQEEVLHVYNHKYRFLWIKGEEGIRTIFGRGYGKFLRRPSCQVICPGNPIVGPAVGSAEEDCVVGHGGQAERK